MNAKSRWVICLVILGLTVSASAHSAEHPGLIMTKAGVEKIRSELGKVPLFDAAVAKVKAEVDAEIELGIDTPIPVDYSGGYTHQRHKQNFFIMQKAGALYQILEDEKYARYVRDMLFQYEDMYLDLPLHPKERSYARGKLFWQCLNDANWLVFVSQAYDTIYDYLSAEERKTLEEKLFRPFADHISVTNPRFFNRVHNHSTWGNAAVGMLGLVMGDDEMVERALNGLPRESLDLTAKDDDGGLFWSDNQKAGFFANLEKPFSPDGYYNEGPYYQRYAMYPFLIFAQGLHNVKPELEIFAQQDSVLLKGVIALLNLSDANGNFFPLNDGQKGMSYHAYEVVTAVDIAFHVGGQDPRLLSIAEEQGQVLLDDAGFAVALAIRDGKAQAFDKGSAIFSDGPDGNQGGVTVLRDGDEDLELVYKFTSQGLGHGHYDKLSFSLYEKGDEVLQDYGMARWVNIGQKGGGNYLPENTTWAKQTIAHNTLIQNEASHFQGKYEIANQHHSDLYFFDDTDSRIQVVSATETNAYPGTELRRTLALIKNDNFEKPFVLDVLKVVSNTKNQYDLPFHYLGHLMRTNFEYDVPSSLRVLGKQNGYQHLYVEGKGKPTSDTTQFSWMNNRRFYTLTSATNTTDELLFTRLGANDPAFNLRRDTAFIVRRQGERDTAFASTIETHGIYNPVSESAINSKSNIAELKVVLDDEDYTAVSIEDLDGNNSVFVISNRDPSTSTDHELEIDGRVYRWSGPYHYTDLK